MPFRIRGSQGDEWEVPDGSPVPAGYERVAAPAPVPAPAPAAPAPEPKKTLNQRLSPQGFFGPGLVSKGLSAATGGTVSPETMYQATTPLLEGALATQIGAPLLGRGLAALPGRVGQVGQQVLGSLARGRGIAGVGARAAAGAGVSGARETAKTGSPVEGAIEAAKTGALAPLGEAAFNAGRFLLSGAAAKLFGNKTAGQLVDLLKSKVPAFRGLKAPTSEPGAWLAEASSGKGPELLSDAYARDIGRFVGNLPEGTTVPLSLTEARRLYSALGEKAPAALRAVSKALKELQELPPEVLRAVRQRIAAGQPPGLEGLSPGAAAFLKGGGKIPVPAGDVVRAIPKLNQTIASLRGSEMPTKAGRIETPTLPSTKARAFRDLISDKLDGALGQTGRALPKELQAIRDAYKWGRGWRVYDRVGKVTQGREYDPARAQGALRAADQALRTRGMLDPLSDIVKGGPASRYAPDISRLGTHPWTYGAIGGTVGGALGLPHGSLSGAEGAISGYGLGHILGMLPLYRNVPMSPGTSLLRGLTGFGGAQAAGPYVPLGPPASTVPGPTASQQP